MTSQFQRVIFNALQIFHFKCLKNTSFSCSFPSPFPSSFFSSVSSSHASPIILVFPPFSFSSCSSSLSFFFFLILSCSFFLFFLGEGFLFRRTMKMSHLINTVKLVSQELILKRFGFIENRTKITFPTVNVMEPATIETTTTSPKPTTLKASVEGINLPFWKYIHCTGAMSVGIPIYKHTMTHVLEAATRKVLNKMPFIARFIITIMLPTKAVKDHSGY